MTEESQFPLVTFALFAYNQENYIREAVEAALAQDYSRLEIILSDDCSNDRTFEIIQQSVSHYSGSARLILNRNSSNLGLARHINQVMSLASGELIVVAAGDDISLPTRVSALVDFYRENDCPDSIFSDYLNIDEAGRILEGVGELAPHEQDVREFIASPAVKGAAHAWTARIYDVFGPIADDVLCEDQVVPFRAYLLNRPRYLDKKLIKYRRLPGIQNSVNYFCRHYDRLLSSHRQYLADLALIGDSNPHLQRVIEQRQRAILAHRNFWHATNWWQPRHWLPMLRVSPVKASLSEILRRVWQEFRA